MLDVQTIRSDVTEIVKHHTYRGDFERPLPNPDTRGLYHYRDKKIRIELSLSPRDGWLSCSVKVFVIRRRWPTRNEELVLSTGHGYDVSVFRPGLWCRYAARLADASRAIRNAVQHQITKQPEQVPDENFTPIDDSSIFNEEG